MRRSSARMVDEERRSALTRTTIAILVAALAGACGSRADPTPTEEEQVRAAFHRVLEAALADDFAREWECFGSTARTYWSEQLALWKALDPGSERWADLDAEHGLTRDEILGLDARQFFVACREGRVRRYPEEWAEQKRLLPSLGPGVVAFQGDRHASLTFRDSILDDVDIQEQVYRFKEEDGEWRYFQHGAISISFPRSDWREPALELPWAPGAEQFQSTEFGLVVNVLVDGRVVVSGEAVGETALRKMIPDHDEDAGLVVFRCDARVPYRVAARWLGLLCEAGVVPVACAVTEVEGGQSMRPAPEDDRVFFQTAEHRLDYDPPDGPFTPDAVVDAGAGAIDVDAHERLARYFAALAEMGRPARVLVRASPDASWDAVVRIIAMLRAGEVRDVALTEPIRQESPDSLRVDGRWPPGPEGAGRFIPPTEHPGGQRILGRR